MYEIVTAGGWLMMPILACSIISLAIIIERFWVLRRARVLPPALIANTQRIVANANLTPGRLNMLQEDSPLGSILAVGLQHRDHSREVLKGMIEDVGRHVAHDLARFLNALGTIAAVSPLLGLLGTVVGMIEVFTTITSVGVGDPAELAGGISQALITTAGGLCVAIPTLMFYRYFRARVEVLVVEMEQQAIHLMELLEEEDRYRREEGEDEEGRIL